MDRPNLEWMLERGKLLGDVTFPDDDYSTVWLVTITKSGTPEELLCTVLVTTESDDWGTMGMALAASEALHWCAHPGKRFSESPQVVECRMIGHALKAKRPIWPKRETTESAS